MESEWRLAVVVSLYYSHYYLDRRLSWEASEGLNRADAVWAWDRQLGCSGLTEGKAIAKEC